MITLDSNMLNAVSAALDAQQKSGKAAGIEQEEGAASFADTLRDAVDQYKSAGAESDSQTLNLLTGDSASLSDIMISSEKAKISLNLTVAIRNKAVDAYKEIMNMQV